MVPLRLPPLRERREDVPLLVEHLVKKHALRLSRPPLRPDADAMKALLDHPWPGNIRELEHAIERGLLLARGTSITLADLPPELSVPAQEAASNGGGEGRYRRARDAWERKFLEDLLREAGGSVGKAAELAGIHRSTLYEKLARYGLVRRTRRRERGARAARAAPSGIRRARAADAPAIARVMRAAIRTLARGTCSPAELAAWSSLPALYHRWAMTAGGEEYVVAEAGGRMSATPPAAAAR